MNSAWRSFNKVSKRLEIYERTQTVSMKGQASKGNYKCAVLHEEYITCMRKLKSRKLVFIYDLI